jgi:hypothetical protein
MSVFVAATLPGVLGAVGLVGVLGVPGWGAAPLLAHAASISAAMTNASAVTTLRM